MASSRQSPKGRDPGTPNCFLFPLPNGAWRVYRFSPGVAEADTWTQDGQGWTTCYFNRYPDLETACTLFGGVEREQGGYVFSSADAAIQAARSLGEELDLPEDYGDRKVTLKAHKDGRLMVEIERQGRRTRPMEGWDDKKGKYVKIFKVKTDPKEDDELDFNEFDGIIRAVETAAVEHAGWVIKEGKEWVRQPGLQRQDAAAKLGQSPRPRPRPSWAEPSHVAGDWSICPSAKSIPAAGNGISTPPNSSSSPPNWPTTKFPTTRIGT